jgi:uncharacterized RDD family membrane protein YckC
MPSEQRSRAPVGGRLAALGLDYLVILGWMAVLAAGSLAIDATVGLPDVLGALGPIGAQAVFFTLLTLPVGLYLFRTESGPAQATWGKRRMGLAVTSAGVRPTRTQIGIRTAVKLLPWEVAHTLIWQMQAVFHRDGYGAEVPVWVFVGLSLVNLAVVVYLAMSLTGQHRGPHDRASRTAVVRRARRDP